MSRENAFRKAFTLIELLVVLAIISILATLISAGIRGAGIHAKLALANSECGEMVSAIQDFRDTIGFYPPDNPANPAMAPLYFELLGTTNDGNTFVTLDTSAQISLTDLNAKFSRQGLVNSATHAHVTDEKGAPMSFLRTLRPKQVGAPYPDKPQIKILVCSLEWPAVATPAPPISFTTLNPWRYVSTHPTHNTSSFDLWVDLPIGGKVYRVSNWNQRAEIVQ